MKKKIYNKGEIWLCVHVCVGGGEGEQINWAKKKGDKPWNKALNFFFTSSV